VARWTNGAKGVELDVGIASRFERVGAVGKLDLQRRYGACAGNSVRSGGVRDVSRRPKCAPAPDAQNDTAEKMAQSDLQWQIDGIERLCGGFLRCLAEEKGWKG
jgi:hypothetical protein